MNIKRLVGGNLESNGYILYCREGGDAYIIDPGYNPERFMKLCTEKQLHVKGILLTHRHFDHVGGVEKIHNELDCPVMIHRLDADLYGKPVDRLLEADDVLELEDEKLEVCHTPGHTHGGVCFYCEKSKAVFTGDTIFNVDLGRTDLEDGSPQEMEASIRNIVSKWENDMTIYPGHGDPATMKYVRQHNQEYLELVK